MRIWDQGGDARPSPASVGTRPFDYGAELAQARPRRAIAAGGAGGLPATSSSAQSQMERGLARHPRGEHRRRQPRRLPRGVDRGRADLDPRGRGRAPPLVLRLDADRRTPSTTCSRSPTSSSEHGQPVPVSINVSLGTNGHAHDDSAPVSRWIDLALTRPGRSVCVAAGNAGPGARRARRRHRLGDGPRALERPDRGARARRRHRVERGRQRHRRPLRERARDLVRRRRTASRVQVKPPGRPWTEPVEPGQFIENRRLPDGSFLSRLQRALPPGQRRQLHRRLPEPAARASRRSSACAPASGWSG